MSALILQTIGSLLKTVPHRHLLLVLAIKLGYFISQSYLAFPPHLQRYYPPFPDPSIPWYLRKWFCYLQEMNKISSVKFKKDQPHQLSSKTKYQKQASNAGDWFWVSIWVFWLLCLCSNHTKQNKYVEKGCCLSPSSVLSSTNSALELHLFFCLEHFSVNTAD